MSDRLNHIKIKNLRALAQVDIDLDKVNILFGPNSSGKSTFLDAIWFIRECLQKDVEVASSQREHGIGLLSHQSSEDNGISIILETPEAEYTVNFGYSNGRVEPFAGEQLYSKRRDQLLIDRKIGSNKASFYHAKMEEYLETTLREPEKLSLNRYMDLEDYNPEAAYRLYNVLKYINFYIAREFDLYKLKKHGSETVPYTRIWERGQNLWSSLRNLKDKRDIDDRYNTIIDFMRQSFPAFQDITFEQVATSMVYAEIHERDKNHPIQASGVSDGYLHQLLLLTALFSEGAHAGSLIMFDEPETSLHPHALSIFAQAVKLATEKWNKQVIIATHSPVLIDQFEPEQIIAAEIADDGYATLRRTSDIQEVQDLLEHYGVGSLYMAEAIAPQSR